MPTFNPDDAIEFWDVTNRQDWDIVEQSQLGIASRRYAPGPVFAAREHPRGVGPGVPPPARQELNLSCFTPHLTRPHSAVICQRNR